MSPSYLGEGVLDDEGQRWGSDKCGTDAGQKDMGTIQIRRRMPGHGPQYAIHGSVLRSRLVVSTPKHTASGGAFQVSGSLVGNHQL